MKPKVPHSKADPYRVSYRAGKDVYVRKIGVTVNHFQQGATPQPKTFLLGSDEHEARNRAGKLQSLWDEQVALGHEEWTEAALEMAEAIRKGQKALVVEQTGQPGQDHLTEWDAEESGWIMRPKTKEVVIRRTELDPAFKEATASKVIPVVVRQPANQPQSNQSLYAALEAYAAYCLATMLEKTDKVADQKPTAWANNYSKSILRTKAALSDCDLALFGLPEIESIILYWKQRPNRKTTGNRISIDTVDDQIKALKRFLKWLHKDRQWLWKMPEGLEDDLFKFKRKDLMTDKELSRQAQGPAHYTIAELSILWEYASQWERFLICLALNCAFAQAELMSLRLQEIYFDEEPVKIKRTRIKSGVHGRFALWSESVAALKWQLAKRKGIGPEDLILVNEEGGELAKTRIPNAWLRLHTRIRKDHKDFRFLPFKFLRKTAGQLVQKVSGGETASVFQSRGQWVVSDELSDRYTQRPFDEVYAALAVVRQQLQPMFDAGPENPFAGNQAKSYISLRTKKTIREQLAQGVPVKEIAKQYKVSVHTVYREQPKADPQPVA